MSIEDNNIDIEPSPEASEEEKPMTAKQFNQALSARERAFEKRLARMQEEHNAVLAKLLPKQEEPQLSQTAELKRTVSDLQKRLNEQDAREKSYKLRQAAAQELRSRGIDGEYTEHCLAYLMDAKQAIKYDQEGNMVFVIDNIEYALSEGAELWSGSKDAKLYKRPTGAQGSGSSSFRANQKGTPSSIELKRDENKIKNFDGSQSTLDRNSRERLSSLLSKKLFNL